MPEQEMAVASVAFRKNGDLVQEIDGAKVTVAHYDRKTGDLEFESQEYATKLLHKITAAIGTVNKGKQSSGLIIKTMGVKGYARDNPKNVPPKKPRRDPNLGDSTPAVVEWMFKYYPHEANVRFGVYLGSDGEPLRKRVRRRVTEMVDDRSGDQGIVEQNEGKGVSVGTKKWENGPVAIVKSEEILDNQIIARRATHMTFTPNEVIGGFDSGDDEDSFTENDESAEGGEE